MEITSKKFYYYFFSFLAAILCLVFYFSDHQRLINLTEINYRVTENNSLRFKNLRQYYYDTKLISDINQQIFRLKASIINNDSIQFLIIENILTDEAFIVPEVISKADMEQLKIVVHQDNQTDTIKIDLPLSVEAYYIFSAQLFASLANFEKVEIISQSNKYQLNETNIKNLKTILKDYFKLVGKV